MRVAGPTAGMPTVEVGLGHGGGWCCPSRGHLGAPLPYFGGCIPFWEVVLISSRLWVPWLSTTVVWAVFALLWAGSGQAVPVGCAEVNQKCCPLQGTIAWEGRVGRGEC